MRSTPAEPLKPPKSFYLLLCTGLAAAGFMAAHWRHPDIFTLVDGRVYASALNL